MRIGTDTDTLALQQMIAMFSLVSCALFAALFVSDTQTSSVINAVVIVALVHLAYLTRVSRESRESQPTAAAKRHGMI